MPGGVLWHGDKWIRDMRAEMKRRTSAAAVRLSSRIKADISQSGTLRGAPGRNAKGKFTAGTFYNFTHSRPGNPPYKQKGHLRRSIAWEVLIAKGGAAWIGRVGTNLLYGRYLELGTRRMAARPYLRAALRKYTPELAMILTRKIPAGGLGAIGSNQFRSGHFGAGARRAGFAA